MTSKILGTAVTALILVSAAQAQAQSKKSSAAAAPAPAASAAPAITHGPPIPGVCVFSRDAAVATSTVGKAFETRYQQLRAQAAAEISGDENSLKTDVQAFQAKRASMTQEQQAAAASPLQQREQALQQKATQRQSELEYTARHQLAKVDQAMEPLVRDIYQQRHCALLLNANGVMGANPAMDITESVVSQLNTRMTAITFDRETPPVAAQ
ncbi:MAG: OmpH/Skp family outer membrane protein [Caulobacteraceae bacterium]